MIALLNILFVGFARAVEHSVVLFVADVAAGRKNLFVDVSENDFVTVVIGGTGGECYLVIYSAAVGDNSFALVHERVGFRLNEDVVDAQVLF